MVRTLVRSLVAIGIISASIIAWSEDPATIVRVLDKTEIGEIGGVVLLVNQGRNFRAFVTDAHGQASVDHLNCEICTVSAIDPSGLFFSRTIEFDSRKSLVTVILGLRPGIDRIGYPGTIVANIKVYGPTGEPLPNQRVVIRPAETILDSNSDTNWIYTETTDSNGQVSATLLPGEFVVAAILGEKPWEAVFHIEKSKLKCRPKARNCIDPSFRASPPTQDVVAHLSATNETSQ